MPRVISATEARANFAEITDRVQYLGEEFVIQKQGKPVVLITKARNLKQKSGLAKWGNPVANFLLKLAKYNLRDAPHDLAQKHDKYTWE